MLLPRERKGTGKYRYLGRVLGNFDPQKGYRELLVPREDNGKYRSLGRLLGNTDPQGEGGYLDIPLLGKILGHIDPQGGYWVNTAPQGEDWEIPFPWEGTEKYSSLREIQSVRHGRFLNVIMLKPVFFGYRGRHKLGSALEEDLGHVTHKTQLETHDLGTPENIENLMGVPLRVIFVYIFFQVIG